MKLFNWFGRGKPAAVEAVSEPAAVSAHETPQASMVGGNADVSYTWFDGEKFFGGFGDTQLQEMDYWTLRKRSAQLFTENIYARGLIRRLITNEVNTGLTPQAVPNDEILGLSQEQNNVWTEKVENYFHLWSRNPHLCDWRQRATFAELQRNARRESLICGDVLIVSRVHSKTNGPSIQLISGDAVVTPLSQVNLQAGHRIEHGVELDAAERHVAYWVLQRNGDTKRIPAFGKRTGRRMAWLMYGTDKRYSEVRGTPFLALMLQSLKEIDRYRDSAQRKATVNSMVAAYIKKTQDRVGTLPMTGGALRNQTANVTDSNNTNRKITFSDHMPGLVLQELNVGEEPVFCRGDGTDVNFPVFEDAIIQTLSWASEMPPEIVRLGFTNNYSASQAALNEFKIYLNYAWSFIGEQFCTPIYTDWLLNEVLSGRIEAQGLLEAWRDLSKYEIFGSWTDVEWYGSIKPTTDIVKQAKGSAILVDRAWSTNTREARVTTGTDFGRNVKRLKRENELLVEAMRPMAEFKQKFGETIDNTAAFADKVEEIISESLGDAAEN